jgi:hypothetical protein
MYEDRTKKLFILVHEEKMTKREAFHFAYIPYVGAEIWILASKYIYFTAIPEENGRKRREPK